MHAYTNCVTHFTQLNSYVTYKSDKNLEFSLNQTKHIRHFATPWMERAFQVQAEQYQDGVAVIHSDYLLKLANNHHQKSDQFASKNDSSI